MELLTDRDIVDLVTDGGSSQCIVNVKQERDWYCAESVVQPCSLDFSIGAIYIPSQKPTARGGGQNPCYDLVLQQGRTAVIVTQEQVRLPNDIAGVGFPPSRFSIQGLLMTNPGHVDPGSQGHLHFTVINMGREPISLRKGDTIFTVLFFRLSEPVHRGLGDRQEMPLDYNMQDVLDRLSVDFMDVEQRAERIHKKKLKEFAIVVPIVTAIIAAGVSIILHCVTPNWKDEVGKVEKDMAVLRAEMNVSDLEDRLTVLEESIKRGVK